MEYEFVLKALQEDIGRGDLYAKVVSVQEYKSVVVVNQNGVLAGIKYAKKVGEILGFNTTFLKQDGDDIVAGDIIAKLDGSSAAILAGERVFLNLLQHASGIASKTRLMAKAAYPAILLDTRKTRPLLRVFEKYATSLGGAVNHRFGLDECLMIKDTHKNAISDLSEFITKARLAIPFTATIEVECGSLGEIKEAIYAGADIVMCDNMSVQDVSNAVVLKNTLNPKVKLEASGQINENNIAEYAKSGVDAISVGSIIHQATWLDFSMKGCVETSENYTKYWVSSNV